jgi:hypothetical protein
LKTNFSGGTIGRFNNDEERALVQVMDRFLHDITKKERRKSWQGGNRTAYTAFENFDGENRASRMKLEEIERVIFRYSVGEETEVLRKDSKLLIMTGVAALHIEETKLETNTVVAHIDEPLIIEAGIQYFGLAHLAQKNFGAQEGGGQEGGYEKLCKLKMIDRLREDFPKGRFGEYKISTNSSYGVIAKFCKGQGGESIGRTLEWLEQVQSATFEGAIASFCFPDELFGPDFVCAMWDMHFGKPRIVICQSKYWERGSQPMALATLVPDWFYHINRAKDGCRLHTAVISNPGLLEKWKHVETKMKSTHFVRVLMQYPSSGTASSSLTEGLHKSGHLSQDKCSDASCRSSHDWLYSIDGQNASRFFDDEVLEKLKYRKGHVLNENTESNMKRQRLSYRSFTPKRT